ncbi:unnamed protein product [Rhizophagus irregularis]|nr:unnamed protein product [Rhizophagus irregularis]
MNTIHNSNVSTHNPGCDLMVYTIEASDSIHSKYEELSDFLFEKDSYKFFDLDKYTSHDGNYLGTINYIWKVPLRNDH